MYTLKEIIEAWDECYGEDMKIKYFAFFKYLIKLEKQKQEEVQKRLLKLLKEEVENFGLTPHIRRILKDEEYAAKQGGDKLDVSVEEFDKFMNEVK